MKYLIKGFEDIKKLARLISLGVKNKFGQLKNIQNALPLSNNCLFVVCTPKPNL
jgi:hypothetical protein